MSLAFAPHAQKNVAEHVSTVQKLLDENSKLIDAIKEYQNVVRTCFLTPYYLPTWVLILPTSFVPFSSV